MSVHDPGAEAIARGWSDADLQSLIEGLNRGDERAIQRTFLAYEPYLRMIVRRRLGSPLRVRMDSEDIVQSIWSDLLPGFRRGGWKFLNAASLRSFLVRATQNRLTDRLRQHGQGLARERVVASETLQSLPEPDLERASQVAQA